MAVKFRFGSEGKIRTKVKDHVLAYMSLEILVDKWWLLLGCSLLCGIVVLVYTTFFIPPVYEAKASLLAIKSDVDINKVKNNIDISNKLLKDYVILAESDMTFNYAIDTLDLPEEYTVEKLRSQMTVFRKSASNIIVISVKDHSPENAADIANALADGLQNTVTNIMVDTSKDFALFSSVFEKAVVSTNQVYPNVPLSVILALLFGFLAAMTVLLLSVIFSSNVVSPGQVKLITNLEILGHIALFKHDET